MKFHEGDKVRVIKKLYGHCFEIGTIGFIKEARGKGRGYVVNDGKNFWYLDDNELEFADKRWWQFWK